MSFNSEWLAVSIAIMVLLLWVEHWFPYPRKAHAILNYSLGVAAIMVGITIYCLETGMYIVISIVWIFSAAAGISVWLAYRIDWFLNMVLRPRDEQSHKTHH